MQSGNLVVASSQALLIRADHLFETVDLFPIPIGIFTPSGASAYLNGAFQECFGILPDHVVGKLNILEDPFLRNELGLSEYLRRVFDGEVLSISDIRAPFEEILRRYGVREIPPGTATLYQNITCFPVWNQNREIAYIVALFLTTRVYGGQPDIAKAREFIENTWRDEFDIGRVAEAVGFSRYHFARLFKKHVGVTPYCYYQSIKVQKLKEALRDTSLSVTQAFAACGVDYSGSFAKLFKDRTGMTPTQYRKTELKG